jgi:hypothetical protein
MMTKRNHQAVVVKKVKAIHAKIKKSIKKRCFATAPFLLDFKKRNQDFGNSPTIFFGFTHSSNSSAVTYPNLTAISFKVVFSLCAF